MIFPTEIQSLATLRKAIYNRQVRKCMMKKALEGEEPYASKYTRSLIPHKLKVIHQELKTLRQYKIAAIRSQRRAELQIKFEHPISTLAYYHITTSASL